MRDEENTIWGENAIKIREFIRNWGKINYPVGALTSSKEKYQWDKARVRCEKYGVNINKGGFIFIIREWNMYMDGIEHIAMQTGFNPLGFGDDIMKDAIYPTLCNIDMQKAIEKSKKIRQETKQNIVDILPLKIYKAITKSK